jgi:DNA polymerase elongation subunit (family B)
MNFYTNFFARGDNVYLRGYKDGKRISEIIPYKPYLFVPARKDAQTPYKTLQGKAVEKKEFSSISHARSFLKTFSDVDNMDVFGLNNFQYLFIYDRYHGELEYDVSRVNVISIDIETDSSDGFPNIETADKEITAITLSRRGEKVVFGMFSYKSKSDKVTYIQCDDEYTLLEKFLHIWQSGRFMPDIVTGWNIEFFDIPYIVNRIKAILGNDAAKKLSPFGFLEERQITVFGKEVTVYIPSGISVLDYYHLYKKFKFVNQESYKLDNIAESELGVKKLSIDGYNNMSIFLCGSDNVSVPKDKKFENMEKFEKLITIKSKIKKELEKRK